MSDSERRLIYHQFAAIIFHHFHSYMQYIQNNYKNNKIERKFLFTLINRSSGIF